eukprot:COSAG06_NODE_22746_length_714_cov_0.827642_2_plen_67_part_01
MCIEYNISKSSRVDEICFWYQASRSGKAQKTRRDGPIVDLIEIPPMLSQPSFVTEIRCFTAIDMFSA